MNTREWDSRAACRADARLLTLCSAGASGWNDAETLLERVIEWAGGPALSETIGPSWSASSVFDGLAGYSGSAVFDRLDKVFETVVAPGEPLDFLQPGDILIERALGQGSLSHAELIGDNTAGGMPPRLKHNRIIIRPRRTAGGGFREDVVPPTGPCWKTTDIIDNRIDVHAQWALMHMFGRGGAMAADASAILSAVKSGRLEGVYLPDEGVPALRARKAGSNWWQMIPPGRRSTCYKQPPNRPPLIVFSKAIKDNRDLTAEALSSAWHECGIPADPTRCYTTNLQKPPKKAECETNQDCIDKGLGNFCTDQKVCGTMDVTPDPRCESPGQCDPNIPQEVWASCHGFECVRLPGQVCGVCRKPGDRQEKCLKDAEKQHKQEKRACDAEEINGIEECVKASAECALTREPASCLEAAEACVANNPKAKGDKCRRKAFDKFEKEQKDCRKVAP